MIGPIVRTGGPAEQTRGGVVVTDESDAIEPERVGLAVEQIAEQIEPVGAKNERD